MIQGDGHLNDQTGGYGATPRSERDRRETINAFSDAIETISRSLVQVFVRQLSSDGITMLQYHALRAIVTLGPDIDMSAIATTTGLPASSITSIVNRLEKLGLVVRHHDSTDRRRVVATTTEDGMALMRLIQARELERLDQLLASTATGDLTVCLKVFHDIENRMSELYHPR